jgi:hypothetical protein
MLNSPTADIGTLLDRSQDATMREAFVVLQQCNGPEFGPTAALLKQIAQLDLGSFLPRLQSAYDAASASVDRRDVAQAELPGHAETLAELTDQIEGWHDEVVGAATQAAMDTYPKAARIAEALSELRQSKDDSHLDTYKLVRQSLLYLSRRDDLAQALITPEILDRGKTLLGAHAGDDTQVILTEYTIQAAATDLKSPLSEIKRLLILFEHARLRVEQKTGTPLPGFDQQAIRTAAARRNTDAAAPDALGDQDDATSETQRNLASPGGAQGL